MPCCKGKNIQVNESKTYDDSGIINIYENMENLDEDKIIEGLDSIGDSIKNAFERPFNQMKDGINKFADDTKNAMNKIPEAAKDLLKKDPLNGMVNKLTDFGDKVKTAFEEIPRRFNLFGKAFKKIFEGIDMEIVGIFKGIGQGFDDIGILFKYFGILIETYLACGVKYIKNLSSCIIYYLIDALLKFVYLPITIALWVVKSFTGKDLYYIENAFWGYMWKINGFVYSFAKFNILKWPKSVRDLCYNCKRLKVSALKREAGIVDYDFRHGIADRMQAGKDKLKSARDDFLNVFSP
uniref:Uncharacterized protein n=1 Tax=viral metagenome TaxID=1070528 RepID=A0A6C0DUG8_9ZZZZ